MFVYPNINPIAFNLGPIKIYWYGILYLVSFAAIWWLALKRAVRLHHNWTKDQVADLIFYGALGVVIGGRVGEMLFYEFSDLLANPWSLFAIWRGGMSFHGGLLGVLISFYIFSRKLKWNFWDVMDFVAPFVPIGLFLGRMGNFINCELLGRVTNVAWAVVYPLVDVEPRHPSQLYEAFGEGIILFVILWFYSSRPKPRGAISMVFLLGYGILRFICEFFREPENPLLWNFLTRGQLLSLPMIVIGGVALFFIYHKHYRRKKMREIIKTERAPSAIGPYSQAIKNGALLFVSGQIPLDPKSGIIAGAEIKAQTKQVLENLKAIVEASGMQLGDVVKCTCFLKSMDDFVSFNAVYAEYFGGVLPARECVEVARLPRDVLVEVSAICIRSL